MTLRQFRFVLMPLLAPALVLAAACGGDDNGDGPPLPGGGQETPSGGDGNSGGSTPAGVFDDDAGRCDVTITGDVEAEFRGPGGPSAVGSDYFMSDEELRQALSFFGDEPTDEELNDDEVDLYLLLLNCVSDDGDYSLSFFPGNETKYSQMPFGPGEYLIAEGGILGGALPGEIGVLATVGELTMAVSEPGEFNITAWDDDHIAGNFSFTMTEPELFATGTPKSVDITGEFEFDAP